MLFEFTDEQRDFASTVQDYLTTVVSPDSLRDDNPVVTARTWSGLNDLGVFGVAVPERLDGAGGTVVDLARVAEAAGMCLVPLPLVETALVAPAVLAPYSERDDVAGLLRAVARGEARVGALLADATLVPYGTDLTHLLVETEAGVRLLGAGDFRATLVDGQDARARLARITYTPSSGSLLDAGGPAMSRLRAAAWTGSALEAVGVAHTLLTLTREHVSIRKQFGRPVGSFQAVKHQAADMALQLEAARSLAWRAAYALAEDDDPIYWARLAQGSATGAVATASDSALQLHGGIGFTKESDLHLWLHAAEALVIRHGPADRHRLAAGIALLSDTRKEPLS